MAKVEGYVIKSRVGVDHALHVIQTKDALVKQVQKEIDTEKGAVKAWMKKNKTEKIDDSAYCTVYTSKKLEIVYDLEAMEQKLDKKLLSQFVDREYQVSDISAFKAVCKRLGVPYSAFKGVIEESKSVNTTKLDRLYDDGAISMLDLDGCYEAKEKTSVGFRIKED